MQETPHSTSGQHPNRNSKDSSENRGPSLPNAFSGRLPGVSGSSPEELECLVVAPQADFCLLAECPKVVRLEREAAAESALMNSFATASLRSRRR